MRVYMYMWVHKMHSPPSQFPPIKDSNAASHVKNEHDRKPVQQIKAKAKSNTLFSIPKMLEKEKNYYHKKSVENLNIKESIQPFLSMIELFKNENLQNQKLYHKYKNYSEYYQTESEIANDQEKEIIKLKNSIS